MIKFALLGVICTANGIAVFSDDVKTYHLHSGESIEGYSVDAIEPRRVMLSRNGVKFYLYTGDIFDDAESLPKVKSGIETKGNEIIITEQLKRFIEKDGLLSILMQAGVEPFRGYNSDGVVVGFKFFSIDAGSVYELAGIENDDVITEVDGTVLDSQVAAVGAMMRVRDKNTFSFTTFRNGLIFKKQITVR